MNALDVGGYMGKYMEIFTRLGCDEIYCFEPLYYKECKEVRDQLQSNNKVQIHLYETALHDNGEYEITIDTDSSSMFGDTGTKPFKDITGISLKDFCSKNSLNQFDYIKINCEGSEYKLLEDIHDLGIGFEEIFVQFHETLMEDNTFSHRERILDLFRNKNYVIHAHKRFPTDHTVWWSISKTDDLKLPATGGAGPLPIREKRQ